MNFKRTGKNCLAKLSFSGRYSRKTCVRVVVDFGDTVPASSLTTRTPVSAFVDYVDIGLRRYLVQDRQDLFFGPKGTEILYNVHEGLSAANSELDWMDMIYRVVVY